ncbi:MAG TPA: phytoene desaturase family protein [Micromonosporaceae bacterium]|jgi:phytoene desaturase
MRTVTGRTDRVIIVGAGLGGLSCALHLAGAGREVTVLEREPLPGGRAGRLAVDGFAFDTGPTVLTAPELIAEPLAAVGEKLDDWLSFTRLDPAYRAFFPDGSRLDVISDPDRMADEIALVCGAREADGYRRFVAFATDLWRLEHDDFIARNLDAPWSVLRPNLLRLARLGAFRSLHGKVGEYFRDRRTQRVFSFQALYAGLAPHRALALYAVISYLDTITGVHFPKGGIHAVPTALAAAATKHGVTVRYDTTVTRVETYAGRARAVHTRAGERIPADVVILNPDLPMAYRSLLPAAVPPRRLDHLRFSPSCVVLHIGSDQPYGQIAHHNLHFGRAWTGAFDDLTRRGRLMRDPSLLVSNPTRTDPGLAPADKHVYYVLTPVPNLTGGGPDLRTWRDRGLADRYADQIVATLEARGYVGFGAGTRVRRVTSPADWAALGHAAGTPFAPAHVARQTGPFRPGNMHPGLSNVVFVGSGTQPGVGVPMVLISGRLAAERVIGR